MQPLSSPNKLTVMLAMIVVCLFNATNGHPVSKRSQDGATIYATDNTTTLSSSNGTPSIVILYYGHNVEGIPTFEIVSASGDTSIFEISYAESQRRSTSPSGSYGHLPNQPLQHHWPIHHLESSHPGSVSLPSGTLALRNVGVKPTTDTTPLNLLPGSFSCSDVDITRIWSVGVRTLNSAITSAALPANLTMEIGSWQSIHATADLTDVSVSVNGTLVLQFSQFAHFYGSFGIGASFGHAAYFQNITATSPTGRIIYTHPLIDRSFLIDFFSGSNPADTIVDGSRRDRIAYSGDLDISVGVNFASTFAPSYIDGSLDLIGSYQLPPGFFLPTAKIQQEPLSTPLNVNLTGLIGYSFNLLTAIAQNYQTRGNVSLARTWAPKVVSMLDWADSQAASGLFNLTTPSFGVQRGLRVRPAAVSGATERCRSERHRLPDPSRNATSILSVMASQLAAPAGSLAFSPSTIAAGWAAKVSPYARRASSALTLLKKTWAPMADPARSNYTGCFWETLNADGTAGLDLVTSLCHGWAAGPTAELTIHVLGVQPIAVGFTQWKVQPLTMGLEWANVTVPTVLGNIKVSWSFETGMLQMSVQSPAGGNRGTVYLPQPMPASSGQTVILVNGVPSFQINGGDTFVLTQQAATATTGTANPTAGTTTGSSVGAAVRPSGATVMSVSLCVISIAAALM
ncbi:glycoside hydrolase family 78 protein [Planoprotostelium fungivorum]|uniref:Glycoside hydrolase family 78 protein n=1 Tax=Planoprotostelium fungivorum TaxID=1890364 RepID=A0A2P6NL35_9EUKA|nr:glycoside hydrolase family 78 protein [Planoprotostelium fungivorum]